MARDPVEAAAVADEEAKDRFTAAWNQVDSCAQFFCSHRHKVVGRAWVGSGYAYFARDEGADPREIQCLSDGVDQHLSHSYCAKSLPPSPGIVSSP